MISPALCSNVVVLLLLIHCYLLLTLICWCGCVDGSIWYHVPASVVCLIPMVPRVVLKSAFMALPGLINFRFALSCYEKDLMLSLYEKIQADVIETFNSTSRYQDDLQNINSHYLNKW